MFYLGREAGIPGVFDGEEDVELVETASVRGVRGPEG